MISGNLQIKIKRLYSHKQMSNIKEEMAKMLAKWLFKDFGLLIEAPEEDDIVKTLEKYEEE